MRRLHQRFTLGRLDRGFSFIELLAYMAIAALLILAAIPQFNQYRQKAVVSNLENDVHNASIAAESALIGVVAKHSDEDGGIHLAATTNTAQLDAITTAVSKEKLSPTTSALTVAAIDADGYSITGTSTKTDVKAVYLSKLDSTRPTFAVGTNLVNKDGNVVVQGATASATPAPTASAGCAFQVTGPTGTPAASGYDACRITALSGYISRNSITLNPSYTNSKTQVLFPTSVMSPNYSDPNLHNVRVWVGSTEVSIPNDESVMYLRGIQSTSTAVPFSLTISSYSVDFLTAAQATSHEPLTISFTDNSGKPFVFKAPWNSTFQQDTTGFEDQMG